MSRVEQLRHDFPVFEYRAARYSITDLGLLLEFSYQILPDQNYVHTVVLHGVTQAQLDEIPQEEIVQLVAHVGLIEAFSYWKATCSPDFRISALPLTTQQIAWWHDLLIQGMGEYFFVNQIEFTQPHFVQLTAATSRKEPNSSQPTPPPLTADTNILIPVGGGKDSVVTLEFLRANRPADTLGCLLINPTQAALDSARLAGIAQVHQVSRQFDPQLKQFTQEHGLNGHVPVSASFAWISLLVARLQGYQLIALSNEASSNEGSVEYLGRTINHQYSKTYEFEQALQRYTADWLSPQTPWYFSLLRPLHELQIAELFAQHTQYHPVFRSCNRGQKTNSWCGNCPKCLFAYLILSPFLPQQRLTELFGSCVLDADELWPDLQQLLGITPQKPLECVGTRAESLAALYVTIQHLRAENSALPSLLQRASTTALLQQSDLLELAQQLRTSWNQHHSLPSALAQQLQTKLQDVQASTSI